MELILWRHAEAVLAPPGGEDLARPLTGKGQRQAERVAQWLEARLPADTRVLVSPARRTQETAAHLPRKLRTVAELAPDGTVDGLLHAARWPDHRGPVLVVGHQPTLGVALNYLLTGQLQEWPLRKAAVAWLRLRERQGQPQVLLHALVGPDITG